MMVSKDDDLGLSLSLGCSTTGTSHTNAANRAASNTNPSSSYQIPTASPLPFHLNLMMPSTSSAVPTAAVPISYSLPHHNPFSSAAAVPPHKTTTMTSTPSWTLDGSNPFNLFSADRSSDATRAATTNTTTDQHQRSFLKGIDVNRLPSSNNNSPADEEEAGVSSPNSTLSSVGGKRCEREPAVAAVSTGSGDDERNSSRGGVGSDDEDGDTSRKKLRLSKDQSAVLEDSFKEHNTLNPKQKLALAKRLGLRPRQVEVWFQNRRARTKLKQTEVDCEFLRRCCEQLTDENRRLQKEVQELRALKLSPQFYMQMTPPTTLTMCPSCERVGGGGSAAAITSTHPAAPLHGSSASTAVGSNKTSSDASRQSVPPAPIQHLPNHHRTMNPWGVTVAAPSPVPIRSIESLQPRS